MRAITTAERYVQQPCDTRKRYLASTTTVHEQQQCLNCFCVIFLCTARPRQVETNYHLCNTSTCCPNFSRPRPPCGYLAAARQAMCNPDECTPWCMSSLPYLTAAQQRLLPQNFHDGDDPGLRHAPPTATTVHASSTLPQQKAGGTRAPVAAASIDLCVVCAVVAPGHVCTAVVHVLKCGLINESTRI